MTPGTSSSGSAAASRRDFLKTSAAAALAGACHVAAQAHVAGNDLLRVGLIGCGGRGTGAAAQALNADRNVQLVALADAFEDRLQQSLATLRKDEAIAAKADWWYYQNVPMMFGLAPWFVVLGEALLALPLPAFSRRLAQQSSLGVAAGLGAVEGLIIFATTLIALKVT